MNSPNCASTKMTLLASHSARRSSGAVRPGLLLIAMGMLAVLVVPLALKFRSSSSLPDVDASTPVISSTPNQTDTVDVRERRARSSASFVPRATPSTPDVAPEQVTEPAAPNILDNLPRTQETIQAAGLIAQLSQLNLGGSPMTPEQSANIAEQLQRISALGTPAVAAIRDFLEKGENSSFGAAKLPGGASSAASASDLRVGVLDSLAKIGGPEAVAVAGEALQKSMSPSEITLLARALEQQAPGQFTGAALSASRQALASLSKNGSTEQDVSGLFQVLQKYGDASVIPELQNLSQQWRYYGMIAMGGMADGQGVSALINMTQAPGAQASGYQQIATQMLAQLATSSAEAQAALIAQAKAGEIHNWSEVAQSLSGARLTYGADVLAGDSNNPDLKVAATHHVVAGNQNFRTINVPLAEPQIAQNEALIEQLLIHAQDPAAREALQKAKANLRPGGGN
ncbi:MAG: hypothetical protein EXS31_15740 [Pedosphaera sp.]|nr:hypothetical protein [Pedosphaera sp.]